MTESVVQARIMLACGGLPGVRLFRNTVGEGWQGRVLQKRGDTVVLENARYVTFGLAPGSADLIGWCDGRFLAIECKAGRGRASAQQRNFLDAVAAAGGVAGVAYDAAAALEIIRNSQWRDVSA